VSKDVEIGQIHRCHVKVVAYVDNRVDRKRSTHDSIAEFRRDLYLVEGGASSDKRGAGEGDLVESWDISRTKLSC
jgi:hypothetical protein